jgi:hypothetical protein
LTGPRLRARKEWWEWLQPLTLDSWALFRRLGLLRREPTELLASLRQRFERSDAVCELLAVGCDDEQIETILAHLAIGYDDPALPEAESPWSAVASDQSSARKQAEIAEHLRATADFFREHPGALLSGPQIQFLRVVAEALRERAANREREAREARERDDQYRHPRRPLGAPGWWATPTVALLAADLEGLPKRWEILAGLARDFFDSDRNAEQVRNLANAYRERRTRRG